MANNVSVRGTPSALRRARSVVSFQGGPLGTSSAIAGLFGGGGQLGSRRIGTKFH